MDFEIPFRELGFSGVPHRSTAFIMPTVCLDCVYACPSAGLTGRLPQIIIAFRSGPAARSARLMAAIAPHHDADNGALPHGELS